MTRYMTALQLLLLTPAVYYVFRGAWGRRLAPLPFWTIQLGILSLMLGAFGAIVRLAFEPHEPPWFSYGIEAMNLGFALAGLWLWRQVLKARADAEQRRRDP